MAPTVKKNEKKKKNLHGLKERGGTKPRKERRKEGREKKKFLAGEKKERAQWGRSRKKKKKKKKYKRDGVCGLGEKKKGGGLGKELEKTGRG